MWNLAALRLRTVIDISWEKFPLVAGDEHARRWLQAQGTVSQVPSPDALYTNEFIEPSIRMG
jgi:hypothetical protein